MVMQVKSSLDKVLETIGVKDPKDHEGYSDYSWDATRNFMREFIANEFSPEEVNRGDVEELIENDVREAIETNVMHSLAVKTQRAIEDVLDRAAQSAGVSINVSFDRRGNVIVDISAADLLKIWRQEVEGMGYAAWGGDEKASDIKGVHQLINIFNLRTEVYGGTSMERYFEGEFDRWEPDTGSYWTLKKIAEKSLKRARKK